MKNKTFKFKLKNTRLCLEVKPCSILGKAIGLMFCRRKTAKTLLFSFRKSGKYPIHSWFVFFPFIALWLDEKNKVLEIKIVKPFTSYVNSEKKFSKLIEIPINKKYSRITKFLVGKTKHL